jgi:hypothetical protein
MYRACNILFLFTGLEDIPFVCWTCTTAETAADLAELETAADLTELETPPLAESTALDEELHLEMEVVSVITDY